MDEIDITVSTTEDNEFLYKKINEFNNAQVPFTQKDIHINISYTLKDKENAIIGGIKSILYCWGCLYIDVLWIDEKYRKNHFGSILLNKVETEAKEIGCNLVHVDTFDFQAKDFYLKNGYELFGELDNCPPGHKRSYLKKEMNDQNNALIRFLKKTDFDDLNKDFGILSEYKNPMSKWEGYFKQQESGNRVVRVVEINNKVIGIGTLKFVSDYPFFYSNKIPEINDILIDSHYQKKGLGKALIRALEKIAKKMGHSKIGLAVGLYHSYGKAQRLYSKMGYVPDGSGITYKNKAVVPGSSYAVDDDLLLWLTKSL